MIGAQGAVYVGEGSDDGMRNWGNEGKGKGWACNNYNMIDLTIKDVGQMCSLGSQAFPIARNCVRFLKLGKAWDGISRER